MLSSTRNGPCACFQIFAHLVIGWPLYLMGLTNSGHLGVNGKDLKDGEIIDHIRLWSKMFPKNLWGKITASTIGVATA